jgi:hypothetical protein
MADNSGGIGIAGVLIGAIIVIGVAFFIFRGMDGGDAGGPDINIEAPSAPSAPSAPAPAK